MKSKAIPQIDTLRRAGLALALLALIAPAEAARRRGCSYGPRERSGKCPSRNK